MTFYKLVNRVAVSCGLLEWGQFFQSDERIVAQTTIDGALVSTVFLGADHNFRRTGPPILFETMIFEGTETVTIGGRAREVPSERYCERCATWDEAEAMHARAVYWLTERKDK